MWSPSNDDSSNILYSICKSWQGDLSKGVWGFCLRPRAVAYALPNTSANLLQALSGQELHSRWGTSSAPRKWLYVNYFCKVRRRMHVWPNSENSALSSSEMWVVCMALLTYQTPFEWNQSDQLQANTWNDIMLKLMDSRPPWLRWLNGSLPLLCLAEGGDIHCWRMTFPIRNGDSSTISDMNSWLSDKDCCLLYSWTHLQTLSNGNLSTRFGDVMKWKENSVSDYVLSFSFVISSFRNLLFHSSNFLLFNQLNHKWTLRRYLCVQSQFCFALASMLLSWR